ncbi:LEAF RUST 10 DISEASE-RESISTANCE LOCUS RECEPTOR-LIKE PROTEIN KINASE-like 2.4 [Pistacia vera]|uniref:LEAF RUST 10 DISEASE-RESISTANCE LOCUS RECEPTOR-LIKE PROTEIN KINASE-like 2.4 n=1 Tax=Pistacia vera TaxID=55513 RepID=UPI001263163A|nr:LEAF RUST 10 DISEASE-RESISTANCE LOCUS RECEPTOR-LIKE PROTEIN KINASE-like 2.4 [Pistacia vera]
MLNSQFFPPLHFLVLLWFIFMAFVKIQPSLSSPSISQPNCSLPFRCGNFTAGYPFWGRDRPSGCGHPDLKLYCVCADMWELTYQGDNCTTYRPTMEINDVAYSILNIDEKGQILRIVRLDYLNGICSPSYFDNSTNSSLLNYDPGYELLTLSYNCQGYASSPAVHFTCSENNSHYDDLYVAEGLTATLENCLYVIRIPVSRSLYSTVRGNSSVLKEAIKEGFQLKWTVGGIGCEECKSNGSCGYDLLSNQTFCYCPKGPSFASCSTSSLAYLGPKEPSPSSGSFLNKRRIIFIGVAACAVGILIILSIFLMSGRLRRKLTLDKVVFFWKDKTENHENIEAIVRNYGSLDPKRYNFSDIKNMTKSFSNKLGQGGYGDVYKGMLPDGPLVAVKVLKESKGNGEEFMNEVANISRTSHVNIVTLLGFCCERNKKALIYEFMPNGSLDKFIYDQESSSMNQKLEWKTKFQIAAGIARGLEYLHRGCSIRIVHFDIKPQNILLNEDFCPKISDFGLAKQSKNKESIISMLDARGTVGYIAPEVYNKNFGGVSHKSDVYSYGMMILEMVGGRKSNDVTASRTSEIYSPHWLFKHLEPGKEEDFKLHGVVTEEEEEMAKKMIFVSSWCIQTFPSDRPSMTKVVEMLEGSLENLQIPPKPSTSSPTMSPPKHLPLQHHQHKLESQEETSGKPGDM